MRRRDPEAQAAGCVIGLLVALIGGVGYLLVQLFRYRPAPYQPIGFDFPYQEQKWVRYVRPLFIVALLLTVWAIPTVINGNASLCCTRSFGSDGQERIRQERDTAYAVVALSVGFAGAYIWLSWRWQPIPGTSVSGAHQHQLDTQPKRALVIGGLFIALIVFLPIVIYGRKLEDYLLFLGAIGGAVAIIYYSLKWFNRSPSERTFTLEHVNNSDQPAIQSTIYTIYPAKTQPDYVTGSKLLQPLLSAAPRLTFQIVGTNQGIYWRVVDALSQYNERVIESHITSHFPQATVVTTHEDKTEEQITYPFYQQMVLFRLSNEYGVPLPGLEQLKQYDPLTAITNRMDSLQGGERVIYAVVSLVATPEARKRALERFQAGYITPTTDVRKQTDKETTRFQFNEALVTQKLSSDLYHCYVVLTVESSDPERLRQLTQVATDVTQYQLAGHNQIVHYWTREARYIANVDDDEAADFETVLAEWADQGQSYWKTALMVLSPAEIAALWHLPNETFSAKRIVCATQPVPEQLTNGVTDGACLGTSITPGRSVRVCIDSRDRAYHHYMIGKTGMGKSTLIHNLIQQDIAAGRGVAVIDPHGKLIADILKTVGQRSSDVVLLECGRSEYPVPLNPLRILPGVTFATVKTNIISALEKIYEDILDYPGVKRTLNVVVNALLCDPDATLLDVYRIFNDETYRDQLISLVENSPHGTRQTVQELAQFGATSRSGQERRAEPILTRTAALVSNQTLEHMLCHPSSLNFAPLIKEQKIVLINLSGDEVSTEAGSLATLFLSNFFTASQTLKALPDGAPPRFYVYLDEAQRVMSGAVIQMLSEVRKFGLSVTLTHQFLGQLKSEIVSGILGNVGTLLVFEVGNEDARTLAPYFEPEIERGQLVNLGAYHIAVKTRAHGRTLPGFIVQTEEAPKASSRLYLKKLHTVAADKLLSSAQVRAWLKERYGTGHPPATAGRSRKKPTPPKLREKPSELEDFE
jgi:hypothetical protein